MKIQFRDRPQAGPERLVCEAEIVFDDPGPLQGMKLVGFSLWRGPEADKGLPGAPDIYVTFPSRAFGGGNERRFFDYLRGGTEDADANRVATTAVKSWILEEYALATIRQMNAAAAARANSTEQPCALLCADCRRPAHEGECAEQARANRKALRS